MVGIVNGSGLGLNFTSYTETMGQTGVWNQGGLGLRGTKIFINGYTGNLVVQDQDGLLAAAGTDLQALRTYNSRGSFNDDNGDNWIAGFVRQAMRLTGGTWGAAGSTVAVTNEDGSERLYTWVTNRYVSTTASGPDTYLTLNAGNTLATFSDGVQSGTFDVATGRLQSWSSPTLLNAVFTYDANGRLSSMASDASATGGRIVYEYSGNLLQRVSVVDQNNIAVSTTLYAYDANGRLSRVTVDLSPADGQIADGKVYTTDYTYVVASDATNGMLRSITNSDGTSQTFKWVMSEGTARISQSWGADGQITDYVINLAAKATRVTQPGGFTTDFWYDGLGRLKQSHPSKGANNGVTTDATRIFFEYSSNDNQATFKDYDLGITAYNYDADNNLILVRDPAGNTVRRTYVNRLVVAETVYAVADPDGSGALTASAPATTRFVYDAAGKLRFKISPEGVVTELRYSGTLPTATITYLGGAYNVSGLTETQAPTEAQLTTWVGGADKSRTSRVDTVYDLRGNKLSETAYANTDAAGNGLAAGQRVVAYAYDAAGRLLSMTDGINAPVTYTYDGLGRVLTRQQGGIATSYVHQEGVNGYVSTVTEQNGLVTVNTFDKMGRLLGVTQTRNGTALGTTTNYYDARGLLYKTQDATGVFHWYLYDERANKVAEVDGNGTVTEFRYDIAQRPIQTIVYATPLAALTGASPNTAWADPPAAPTLASIRPAEVAGKDIKRWTVYDPAGRPIKTVDGAGFVTETRYDGTGRVAGTVRYANAIDLVAFAANPVTANATPTADLNNDRVTRRFYSTEGRLQGELDAEGYLVEYRYDAAGRLAASVRYADPTDSTKRAAGTLAQLRPGTGSPKDQTTRFVYDGQNRQIGEIDAEGFVTEQLYDDRGNVVQRTRYAAALTTAQLAAFDAGTGAWRPAGTAGLAGDRTEYWHFNTLGQLDERTDADGTVTRLSYDEVGRVVSTTRAVGTLEVRTQKVRYDGVGRVIGELSARGAALLVDGQTEAQVNAIWAQYGTIYTYDEGGRKTSQIVSDGTSTQRTIFFYNEDGQLTHTISALGEVQENQYDGIGQLVKTIAYGGRLSATTFNGLLGGLANTAIRNAVQELLAQRTPGNQAYANAQSVFDYDARGLIRSTTDASGYTSSSVYNAFGQATDTTRQLNAGGTTVAQKLEYDRRGVLVTRTDDFGGLNAITRNRVDAFGRVYEQIDARGVYTKTGYDRLGRVVQTTDGALVDRFTTYDAFSRVVTTTDGNSQTTTYRYDIAARTVEVTTPENIKSRVSRNRHGEVERATDGAGVTTTYAYTENGELKATTTPLNGVNIGTGTKYDSLGRVAETTDANGTVTKYEYDNLNRITTRTVNPGGLALVTSYVYEDTATGSTVLTTEVDGRQTLKSFDVAGRLVASTVDPSGLALTTRFELDADGRTLKVTDPNNIVTRYEYDKLGRRTAEVTDDGVNAGDLKLTRTYVYDLAGRLASSTDWTGARTLYAYDDANRLVYQVDPMGAVRYTEYDGEGRERRVTRLATPLTATNLTALGTQPTVAQITALRVTVPAKDEVTGRVFDKDGRVQFSVDAMGTVTEFRYDGAGRVKQQIAYATPVTPAAWMDAGAAAPAGSADDRVTSTLYDDLGRATTVVDAEGGITVLAYDAAGNLRQKTAYARVADAAKMQALRTAGSGWNAATLGAPLTHAQDRVTNYRYDTAGRLRYEYDAGGYVTETVYQGLKTTVIRHAAANIAVDAVPPDSADDRATSVELDKAGRVWKSVDAMGVETRSVYDKGGRLTAQTQAYGLAEATTTGYVYDDAGHVVLKTVAQGTDAASGTRYGYDALGRMTTEIESRGVALAELDTAWARKERLAQGKAEFAAQLPPADKQAFLTRYTTTHEYDAAGRRKATINAMGFRTSTEYDAFGNAVKVTDPLGNVGYFYFDKLNRVTMQVDPEGNATRTIYAAAGSNQVAKVRRYFVKALGATTAQMPDPVTHAKDSLTTNVYDRLDRLVSTTTAVESGNVTESTQYSAGGNRFDRQVTNKVGGTAVFNTDKLGNTVKETLPVTVEGKPVVNVYEYNAFGDRTKSVEAQKPAGASSQWLERTTLYRYDKAGRVTHRIGVSYKSTEPVTMIQRDVVPVELTRYDALGRVIESVQRGEWNAAAGTVSAGARTLSYYDAAGGKTGQVAADGAVTLFELDASGQVVRERAMATRITPPAAQGGALPPAVAEDTVNDRVTRQTYDVLGRLVLSQRENVWYWESLGGNDETAMGMNFAGLMTLAQKVYDANGNVLQEIDGRGGVINNYYDKIGRKVLRIDQARYAVAWDYGDLGDVATRETKYAKDLAAGAFERQDDAGKPANLRDPAQLRAAMDATGARVSETDVDRLGRVIEKRVLGVDMQYVDADGSIRTVTGNAVTGYSYNGLGNVTQIRERVALAANGRDEVVNVTDIAYDKLGRETQRQSPAFVDVGGVARRPTTDTEYDGLGNLTRLIQRGTDDGVETDDRISRFEYNANGDKIVEVDAAANYTLYALDAMGRVAATTRSQVLRADGSRYDIVKRTRYDQMGRVTAEMDTGSGDVRRIRYNAFGEVTGKGLGIAADVWQETADYNVLGKLQRGNSDGGVYKIYLYDRNGNATREISGDAADLSTVSVTSAATNTLLNHSFSLYDKRNLRTKTVEISISYLKDEVSARRAFTQQLADLYGAISLANAGGGAYTGADGRGDGPGFSRTDVGSSGGVSPLDSGTTYPPSQMNGSTVWQVDGAPAPAYYPQPAPPIGFTVDFEGESYNYSTGPFDKKGPQITVAFQLSGSMPTLPNNAAYRLISRDQPNKTIDVRPGQRVNLYTGGIYHAERFSLVAVYGNEQVVVSELTSSYYAELLDQSEWGGNYAVNVDNSVTTLRRMLIPNNGDQVRAFRVVNGQEFELPVGQPGQFLPDGVMGPPTPVNSVLAIYFDGVPNGDSDIVIRTYRNGAVVAAMTERVTVDARGARPVGGTIGSVGKLDMDVGAFGGGVGIRFRADIAPNGAGTAYYRAQPPSGGWTRVDFSGGGISEDALRAAVDVEYELLVFTSNGTFQTKYKGQNVGRAVARPVLSGSRMSSASEPYNPSLQFQFVPSQSGPYVVKLWVNGQEFVVDSGDGRVDGRVDGTTFAINWWRLKSQFGLSALNDNSLSYEYKVYANRSGRSDYVAHGTGNIRAGAIFGGNTTASTAYPPIATLGVAGLAGPITLSVPGVGAVVIPVGDVRRWESGGVTYLDLGQWQTASSQGIGLTYSDSRASIYGTLTLAANGQVSASITSDFVGYQKVHLEVPGADQLSTLKIGPTLESLQPYGPATRVSAGVWEWNVSLADRGKSFEVYYETRDVGGNINYKGYGRYEVDGAGVARFTPGRTVYKPSVMTFTPPASTADNGFVVQVRRKSPPGDWVSYNAFSLDGAKRILSVDGLRVEGVSVEYEYQYTARDANAVVVSKGSGTFTIGTDGVVSPGANTTERQPLAPITLQGPGNRGEVTKLELTYSPVGGGQAQVVVINGVWNEAVKRMEYTWAQPLGGRVLQSAEQFDYQIRILRADNSVRVDESGDPGVITGGRMTLGGSYTEPVKLQQMVSTVTKDAQVRHMQTYNAFGEIVEEYDDATLARAQAMVGLYRDSDLGTFTLDPNAVRTVLKYNALGKLVSKQEPQTFETMANGFVRRITPLTTYGYDLLGRMTVTTDANGNASRQTFSGGSESVAKQWAGDGGWRLTEYDVFGDARRSTVQVDAQRNAVTEQDFDAMGRLQALRRLNVLRVQNFSGDVRGAATVASTLTESFVYDALGQRIKHTDTLGYIDTTDYDTLGRVRRTVSGGGQATGYDYRLVAAGESSDAIVTLGGKKLGGYIRTTTTADGYSMVDKIDYFGRTTSHQDMGGATYTYNYDKAGQLASQTSTTGQNIAYSYLRNGYLAEVRDFGAKTFSRYGYDDAGNRTSEAYAALDDGVNPGTFHQADTIQYDELNRIARVWDAAYKSHDLRYEYDAVGNRRAAIATYWDPATRARTQRDDLWYTYDAANRFTTTKGSLTRRGTSAGDTGAQILRGEQGTTLSYDFAGQRIGAVNADGSVESYSYSIDGYLEDVKIGGLLRSRRRVDAEGRTMQYLEWDAQGAQRQIKRSLYDADNRLQEEQVSGGTNADGTSTYEYFNAKGSSVSSLAGAGALAKVSFVSAGSAQSSTTTYAYKYFDSAKQDTIAKTVDGRTGTSKFTYNVNGHLTKVVDGSRTLEYFNSAQGLVLERRETKDGKTYLHDYYYATGRRVGDVTNDPTDRYRMSYAEQLAIDIKSTKQERDKFKYFAPVTSGDFDQNYEPINASYPGPVGSAYTVRSGDTLTSIAQSVWGDSAMWYLLAEANGLSGGEALVEGQVLVIPNKVTNIHNNANTFRPYNPGEVIGNVDPTVPPPPPPAGKGGCGGIGMILMVVVAVVVTIYTAGALSGVTAGFMQTMAAGASVMSGGAGLAGVAYAAAGAAVGSVASQAVGMATGNVDRFSWKAVGQSAFSAGVTAGVGGALNSALSAGGILNGTPVGNFLQSSGTTSAMVRAGVGSAVSQAVQGKWSWREVGASTVAGGAGYLAGEAVGSVMKGMSDTMTQVAKGIGASVAGSWASSQVMGYNSAETRARLSQAFISGLAQGIGQALSMGEGNVATSGSYRNGSDMDSDRYVATSAGNYQNGADIDSSDMDEYERNERELKARAIARDTGGSAPVTGGTWENVEGYRSRFGGSPVGSGRAGLLGDAQASIPMAQSPERAYTVAPSIEPGVYGFESGTNVFGRFQAGWYTSPLDQVGLLGENRFRLPTAVVTTDHGLAVEAWQQYADRIEAARPQSMVPASTFWGGYGQTMGAAWNGFAGGVANLASDLANRRFAEGGVKARSAFFQDVDRMGYWRAGLLRAVEGTLSPWMLGGSIVDSSTGTVGSLWRGDMAGAGRNFATLTLDSAAATAMVVGGRAGLSARTSFKPLGWIDVAEGFVPKARTYADFMKWIPNRAPDPGVPQLVDLIEGRFPGLVRQVEIPIHDVPPAGWNGPPPVITDLDIVLEGGRVIQVKEGSGGKIVKQLASSKEITGVDPIGFDVNKLLRGDEAPGFKPGTVREAARQGYTILNTVDDLLNHLDLIYGAR